LEVSEAGSGNVVEPGKVLIAPGDHHLELRRQGVAVTTALHHGPPENSCRPAVDVLFRSAAHVYGAGCQAVVLTGMGKDGLLGSEQVSAAGGSVLAQDEASCVVWGMPRAVTEAGLANNIVPLISIPTELQRLVAIGRPLTIAS
jgi:two-component system chemotaxis response regulator CheB